MLANVRSIKNKLDYFYSVCCFHNIELAIITESWLTNEFSASFLNWNNFLFFSECRKDKRGGGVAVWCHNKYNCERIEFTKPENLLSADILALKLSFLSMVILLITIYIPPSENNNTEIETHIIDLIELFQQNSSFDGLFICGDFNRISTFLLEGELNVSNIVTDATRGNATLDKIFLSPCLVGCVLRARCIDPIASSDHNAIVLDPQFTNDKKSSPAVNKVKVYDFRKSNLFSTALFLSSINWSSYFDNKTPSSCVEIFYDCVSFALSLVPFKMVNRTTKDKSWINNTIKTLINDRYKAFYKKDFAKYKSLQNRIRVEIKAAKSNYINYICKKQSIWKAVSEIQGRKSKSKFSQKDVTAITTKLASVYKETSATYIFTDFYSVTDDLSSIPNIVEEVTNNFNIKKAVGIDKVPNKFIRLFSNELITPLSLIVKNIIQTASFPSSLKKGLVVPIPKAGKISTSNFRPITILNGFSRIIEKCIFTFYEATFVNSYGQNQFGFRKGSSTTLALIYALENVRFHLKNPNNIGCLIIAIDLSKAFDCVNHKILVEKIQTHSNHLAKLIYSYLENRSVSVCIDGVIGDSFELERGVPQGSCLGPALFNLYVADLSPRFPTTTLLKYADDITLLIPITEDHDANIITEEILNIETWCEANKMAMNKQKTQMLPIMKKGFNYKNESFAPCTTLKLLGVTLDKNINFTEHFKSVCSIACRNIYILKSLKGICNNSELQTIFTSKICSIIEYSLPVVPKISSDAQLLIQRIYKRCNKLINAESPVRCVTSIRDNYHLRLFNKILSNPSIFASYFPKQSHTGRFILSNVSTQRDLLSFFNYGAKIYNLNLKR